MKIYQNIFLFKILFLINLFFVGKINVSSQETQNPSFIILENTHILEYKNKKNIILDGKVRLLFGKNRLEADRISFDLNKKNLNATGKVLLSAPNFGEIQCSTLLYSLQSNEILLTDIRSNIEGLYLKSKEARILNGSILQLKDSSFTTCELQPPHYTLKAKRLKVASKDKLIGSGITFSISKIPLIYLPYYYQDLKDNRPFIQLKPGHNSHKGFYIKSSCNYSVNKKNFGSIYLDLYQKLGVGFGFEHRKVSLNKLIFIYGYFIDEALKRKRYESRLWFQYDFKPNVKFSMVLTCLSDRFVIRDYNEELGRNIADNPRSNFDISCNWKNALLRVGIKAEKKWAKGGIENNLYPYISGVKFKTPLKGTAWYHGGSFKSSLYLSSKGLRKKRHEAFFNYEFSGKVLSIKDAKFLSTFGFALKESNLALDETSKLNKILYWQPTFSTKVNKLLKIKVKNLLLAENTLNNKSWTLKNIGVFGELNLSLLKRFDIEIEKILLCPANYIFARKKNSFTTLRVTSKPFKNSNLKVETIFKKNKLKTKSLYGIFSISRSLMDLKIEYKAHSGISNHKKDLYSSEVSTILNLRPTETTRLKVDLCYNLSSKIFNEIQLTISKDLHCWEGILSIKRRSNLHQTITQVWIDFRLKNLKGKGFNSHRGSGKLDFGINDIF
jgi:hypothetical protein